MRVVVLLALVLSAFAQPAEWLPRGRGGGGSQFNPSISPFNASEFYVGCDMGEWFHTTDNGLSFEIVDFRQLTSSPTCVVRFTSDAQVRYALDSEYGARPVKSTDGGATWNTMDDPTSEDAYALFADPNRTDRVIVGGYDNLYFSSDGGANFSDEYSGGGNGLHLAGAFFRGDTIYVGTNQGLLRSTNAGASFSLVSTPGIAAGQAIISFAGSVVGGTVRFLCTTAPTADVYPGIGGADFEITQGLYTYTLGDASWVNRIASLPAGSIPFWVGMSHNEIDTLWAAGSNPPFYHPHILRSTNGGANWTSVMSTVNNVNVQTGWCGQSGDEGWGWAGQALGFAVAPNNPWQVMITDYGFTHITTDGGASFRALYVDASDLNPSGASTPQHLFYHSNGLEPTSVWHIHWSSPTRMFASWTDITAGYSNDGGETWARPSLDDNNAHSVNTIYHVVQHANGKLYGAGSSIHDLYQSTYLTDARIDGGDGQIWLSLDSSATWTMMHDFNHPVIWLALDPTNSERMYASVVHSTQGGIFVTNNLSAGSGSTWTRVGIPPRTQGHPYIVEVLNDGTVVCTYSGRRTTQFTYSSGTFVSANQGATWTDRSDSMMVYWTKDIVIDPHDAAQNTWYVAVHRGWGGAPNDRGGVFRSTNRGVSWTRICDELYSESIAIHPNNADIAYVTTETAGLLYTENLSSATPTWTALPEYPFAHPQRVFFNPFDHDEVWVASFGNGMRKGTTAAIAAPLALTAIAVGDSLAFHWQAVSGAAQYKLWSSADTHAPFETYTLELSTANTTAMLPVSPSNMRIYAVTAE
ncbi:MAG: hypothetical protein IPH10_00065 [bacterium]|nr:hypothetical protein [bacterium]